MDMFRPLIRQGGRTRQLAEGEKLPASVIDGGGGAGKIRFYDSAGARHYLPLDENLELPITLSDGSVSSVPTIGVLHG